MRAHRLSQRGNPARFGESVRGGDVFILQTHSPANGKSVNDLLMEQWVMIDAAKRGSAKRITAVCPRYGYGRQDRKSRAREPITARMVADFFHAAGAERIMSVDLHSGQVQGFFDGPVDHLTAVNLLVDYLKTNVPGDFVMVAPDTGRTKVAERQRGARVTSTWRLFTNAAVSTGSATSRPSV